MIKVCLTWIDKRTGKDATKFVWFENEKTAQEYADWVKRETGRTIRIIQGAGTYR